MKLLRTLSMLCCAVLLLLSVSGCAETNKLNRLYVGSYSKQESVLSKVTTVIFPKIVQSENGFLLTCKDSAYQIYDLLSEKNILNYIANENETVALGTYELNGVRAFTLLIQTTDKDEKVISYKTNLYSAAGNLLASEMSTNVQPMPVIALDLLVLDDTMFRASGIGFVKVGTVAALGNHLSSFREKMADYYYTFDADCFSVYASDGAFYDIYLFEKADQTKYYLLQNGNVLIQYFYKEPDSAEKFDYIEAGTKYSLKTYLWQVERKSAKQISFSYFIDRIIPVTQELRDEKKAQYGMSVSENLENCALLFPINGQRRQSAIWVTMKNDGKVDWNMSESFKGLSDVPYPVANGIFAYHTVAGQTFYIDGNGELLKDVTSVEQAVGSYLVADGKLYDSYFNLLLAYEKEGYTLVKLYESCAIFRKDDEYIRFNGAIQRKITDIRSSDIVVFSEGYYQVTATNGETAYYAPDGTQIYKTTYVLTPFHAYGNQILFSYVERESTKYVMFVLE